MVLLYLAYRLNTIFIINSIYYLIIAISKKIYIFMRGVNNSSLFTQIHIRRNLQGVIGEGSLNFFAENLEGFGWFYVKA